MPNHDQLQEDCAAYVLGALSDQEAAALRLHLDECMACRHEVERLRAVTAALARGVPPVAAPPELRGRIMDAVTSQAELFAAAQAPVRAARRRRVALRPAFGFAAGVALALGILLGALVIAPGGSSPARRVISARVAPATRWRAARAPHAALRQSGASGTLVVTGMPAAPPGKIYEIWVERGSSLEPTDALFTPSSSGDATVAVPLSLRGASAVLVTAERLGGASAPTMQPLITARLG